MPPSAAPRDVLIAGCGYVGTRLGLDLAARGHRVWGLRRDPHALPAGIHPVAADLATGEGFARLPKGCDYAVFAASPGEFSDAAYERTYVRGLANLLQALRGSAPRRVFFVSSSAVYAQVDGSWVDESSATDPSHFSGLRTLEAERLLFGAGLPATVLRCSGIYGPGRTRLIDSVRGGSARGNDRYTNRIHRDDVAGAIAHLMDAPSAERLLLLSDDDPAPQHEVLRYIAELLGVPEPPRSPGSAPAERGGHKRCSNRRLKATGYRLKYPSYRDGYADMLRTRA